MFPISGCRRQCRCGRFADLRLRVNIKKKENQNYFRCRFVCFCSLFDGCCASLWQLGTFRDKKRFS